MRGDEDDCIYQVNDYKVRQSISALSWRVDVARSHPRPIC